MTQGYLSSSGARVSWAPEVPLGKPFSVRDPLWAWGTERGLINDDGSAIGTISEGLFFDGVALPLRYVLVVLVRGTSPRRSQPMSVSLAQIPAEHREHNVPIAIIT